MNLRPLVGFEIGLTPHEGLGLKARPPAPFARRTRRAPNRCTLAPHRSHTLRLRAVPSARPCATLWQQLLSCTLPTRRTSAAVSILYVHCRILYSSSTHVQVLSVRPDCGAAHAGISDSMYLWSAFDGAVMETNVAFEESLYQQVPACVRACR